MKTTMTKQTPEPGWLHADDNPTITPAPVLDDGAAHTLPWTVLAGTIIIDAHGNTVWPATSRECPILRAMA